jgi:hypothetical protein
LIQNNWLTSSTGWFNNCASWTALYSRGPEGAYLDLNMKTTIQKHIFSFYLPMTAASLVIQLLIAALIIWMFWDVMQFTIWTDEENRKFFEKRRKNAGTGVNPATNEQGEIELGDVTNEEGQSKGDLAVNERELTTVASSSSSGEEIV